MNYKKIIIVLLILSVLFINSVSAELDGETILNLDKDILNPDEDIINLNIINQTYIGSYLNLDVERIDNSTFILHYELNETFNSELDKCKEDKDYIDFIDKYINITDSKTKDYLNKLDEYPIKSLSTGVSTDKLLLNLSEVGTLNINTSGIVDENISLGFGTIQLKTIKSKILNFDKKVVLENDYGLNLKNDSIVSYEYSYNNTCYSESADLIITIDNCHQLYKTSITYDIQIENKKDEQLTYNFLVSSGNNISYASTNDTKSKTKSKFLSKDMIGNISDDFYSLKNLSFGGNETITLQYTINSLDTKGKFNIIGYDSDYNLTEAIKAKQYIFLDPTWDDAKVSYWNADTDGSFPDSWGSHTGTIDGATFNSDAYINGGYDFVTNDNILLDISSDWNGGTNNAFSIVMWVYANQWGVAHTFASNFKYLGSGNSKGFTLNIYPSYVRFRIADVDTCRYTTDISGGWHHVVGTYDGTYARLYVDADLKDTDAVTHNIDSTNPLSFGAWENSVGGKGEYFDGTLDEIAFFDKALSITEIQDIYDNGLAPAADTCSEPSINTNHEFDLSDNCVINDDWNIGTGNITFINTGTITFNATIIAHNIASLPADQKGYLGEGARIRVG